MWLQTLKMVTSYNYKGAAMSRFNAVIQRVGDSVDGLFTVDDPDFKEILGLIDQNKLLCIQKQESRRRGNPPPLWVKVKLI